MSSKTIVESLYNIIISMMEPFTRIEPDFDKSRTALFLLKAYDYISDETYNEICLLLPRGDYKATDFYENGDIGYSDGNSYEVFDPTKAISWILLKLRDDCRFRYRLGFKFNNVEELLESASLIPIASKIETIAISQYESFNARVVGNGVFSLKFSPNKGYTLFFTQRESVSDRNMVLRMKPDLKICDGLEEMLQINGRFLYCKYLHRDCYLKIDSLYGEEEIIHDVIIIGFTHQDGKMIYIDKTINEICFSDEKKHIRLADEDSIFTSLRNDHIYISSDSCKWLPYKLDFYGNKKALSEKEMSRAFWEYVIRNCSSESCISINGQYELQQALINSESCNLSIDSMKDIIRTLEKGKVIKRDDCKRIKYVLSMIKKAGVKTDQDITHIIFKLMKISNLCSKASDSNVFSTEFCVMLKSVSEKDCFSETLINNTDSLFALACKKWTDICRKWTLTLKK